MLASRLAYLVESRRQEHSRFTLPYGHGWLNGDRTAETISPP